MSSGLTDWAICADGPTWYSSFIVRSHPKKGSEYMETDPNLSSPKGKSVNDGIDNQLLYVT